MVSVPDRLAQYANERDLEVSTVRSYTRLLKLTGLYDTECESVTKKMAQGGLSQIETSSTRRSAAIVVNGLWPEFGIKSGQPIIQPKNIPDATTIELLCLLTQHGNRLLIGYRCGLRIGEIAAINSTKLNGDMLLIDEQLTPKDGFKLPKGNKVRRVVVPRSAIPLVESMTGCVHPDRLRKAFKRAAGKVGIPEAVPHVLPEFGHSLSA
jgi:integrase